MTLKEAIRSTGLSRRQLRYLEERMHLGFVARVNGRTTYSQHQVEFLQVFARLRALDLGIEEAAQIAGECQGAARTTDSVRLADLAARALIQVEIHSRAAADLLALMQRLEKAS